MTNYIYRASIKEDGTIGYRDSKGKSVSYKPSQPKAKNLFSIVNKYFTGESPNITPQEQVQLRADIAKTFRPTFGGRAGNLNVYEGIDFLLATFSDKASEGGENITPNEVYQMFETFHNWTK